MTIRIEGKITRGEGKANLNYKTMIEAAAQHCQNIKECGQFGTINVVLDKPLRKSHADCWTPRTTWYPPKGLESERQEAWGFIKIKFECPLGDEKTEAWIIIPEGHSSSYSDNNYIEVIAEKFIAGVKYGERCAIHIDHDPSETRPEWFGEIYSRRYV